MPPIGNRAAQRDLAGHGDGRIDLAAREQARDRRDHRDAGRRPVLGDRAGRHVDVQSRLSKSSVVDAEVVAIERM
jgi:hypothetical protein